MLSTHTSMVGLSDRHHWITWDQLNQGLVWHFCWVWLMIALCLYFVCLSSSKQNKGKELSSITHSKKCQTKPDLIDLMWSNGAHHSNLPYLYVRLAYRSQIFKTNPSRSNYYPHHLLIAYKVAKEIQSQQN